MFDVIRIVNTVIESSLSLQVNQKIWVQNTKFHNLQFQNLQFQNTKFLLQETNQPTSQLVFWYSEIEYFEIGDYEMVTNEKLLKLNNIVTNLK